MLDLKETKQEHVVDANVVRMRNLDGDYHFYYNIFIKLHGPVAPDDDCGFLYFAYAQRDDRIDHDDIIGIFHTPEEAWEFYMDFRQMLEGSAWRRDYANDCIMDPDGIRFALTGEKLP